MAPSGIARTTAVAKIEGQLIPLRAPDIFENLAHRVLRVEQTPAAHLYRSELVVLGRVSWTLSSAPDVDLPEFDTSAESYLGPSGRVEVGWAKVSVEELMGSDLPRRHLYLVWPSVGFHGAKTVALSRGHTPRLLFLKRLSIPALARALGIVPADLFEAVGPYPFEVFVTDSGAFVEVARWWMRVATLPKGGRLEACRQALTFSNGNAALLGLYALGHAGDAGIHPLVEGLEELEANSARNLLARAILWHLGARQEALDQMDLEGLDDKALSPLQMAPFPSEAEKDSLWGPAQQEPILGSLLDRPP